MTGDDTTLEQATRLFFGDEAECEQAAAELIRIGEPAVRALIAILGTCGTPSYRQMMESMGSVAESPSESPSASGYRRWRAITVLNDIGTEDELTQATFVAALEDPDGFARGAAAKGLGDLGPRAGSAVPALRQAALDADPSAALWAQYALARITSTEESKHAFANSLAKASQAEDKSQLRVDAAFLFLLMAPPDGSPPLIDGVADEVVAVAAAAHLSHAQVVSPAGWFAPKPRRDGLAKGW
jgi:HEAT repeat protein